jgi:hypothetical protein
MTDKFIGLQINQDVFKSLVKKLNGFKDFYNAPVFKKAVEHALQPALEAAKNNIPVDTGFSRDSLGIRIKNYSRGKTITAWVGAYSKAVKDVGIFQSGKHAGLPKKHRPSKILHLLEFGAKHFDGNFMITTAYYNTRQEQINRFIEYIQAEITRRLNA